MVILRFRKVSLPRMTMRSRRCLYFLVLLTFWAQVDGALLPAAFVSQSASPLSNDSDDSNNESIDSDEYEFLPSQRLSHKTGVPKQVYVSRQPKNADWTLDRRGVPLDFHRITPFTPPLLYLFMSLQI